MPFLRIEKGPQAGEIFELGPGDDVTIGREVDNFVHLMDETSSRHHSRVLHVDGVFRIQDLGSANGTRVNGKNVEDAELASGDRIRVGATTLTFEVENRFSKDTVIVGPDADGMTVLSSISDDDVDPLAPKENEDAESRLSRLSALVSVATSCHGALEAEEFVDRLHGAIQGEFGPDRVCFQFFDDKGAAGLTYGFGAGGEGGEGRRIGLSTAVKETVIDHAEGVLIESRAKDRRFSDRLSLAEADVKSAVAVPFIHGGRVFGVMYLDRLGKGSSPFAERDLRLAAEFAKHLAPQMAGILRSRKREEELRRLRAQRGEGTLVVGESPALQKVVGMVEKVAPTDSSVLLFGETGTGKEVVARLIHERSLRAEGPFVAVNCAAVPEDLMESEFFGHEKGAFTGATGAKKGKLQLAEGGTLFLDEIGEIPVHLQSKLLRAIEEKIFFPVGADREVKVEFRILAATNRDLAAAIEEGSFRRDLYYRLSVVTIPIPPLRERRGDVRLLVDAFVHRLADSLGAMPKPVSEEALKRLEEYAWPGNVRELRNAVERALILAEGREIGPGDLVPHLASPGSGSLETKAILTLKEAEELAIRRALEFVGWKKGEAVKLLGTSWPTLNKKIKEFGIEPPT